MNKVLFLMVLSISALFAETLPPVLNIDGTKYEGVVYQKHDAASVQFMHSEGIASVSIAKLPEDIQKQFNYDPAAAAVESQKQLAEKSDRERQIAEKKKAALKRAQEGGEARDESMRQTEIKKLKATIKSCSDEMDRLAKEFNASVDASTSRNVRTDILGDQYVPVKAAYAAENTPANVVRKDRVEALQKTIDSCVERLKEIQ